MNAAASRSFVKPCPAVAERRRFGRITMNAIVAGEGRPIVFIHGLGWDHSLWGSAMTRFAGRYRTIAGDTRGHGASDKPEGPYSIAGFAADWAELIAAFTESKALIVGFSLGGMIAQTLALDHPELVGGLILVNTSCRSPSTGSEHLKARLEAARRDGPAAAAMLAAQSVFSRAWRDAHPAELADFVDWRVGQDQRALGEVMRAASNFDLCDRVGMIAVPTLVVTAPGDGMMPPADQALLTQLIPGADYAAIGNAGHMVQIEQPEAFEAIVESFLGQHWPPAPDGRTTKESEADDSLEGIADRKNMEDPIR